MIHARGIEVRYQKGGALAVSGVDIDLAPGQGLLLTGDRGSGKSSVLRALLGLAGPGGDTRVCGLRPGDPDALARIGWAPQGWPFTYGLKAQEAITMVARLKGHGPAEAQEAMERAGFTEPGRLTPLLEIEQCRQLSLACALIGDPDLLVLDDPWEFQETEAAIRAALARGAAVIAASSDPGGLPSLLGRTMALSEGAPA